MSGHQPKSVMRQRVCAFLDDNPGACLQEIADHLGVHRNAAAHHVSRLIRKGHVTREAAGRRKIHFLQSKREHSALRRANATMRLATARKVLHELHLDPTASWRGLARSLGLSPNSVRWQIQRLQDEGLIHVMEADNGTGHEVVVHPEVREVLDPDGHGSLHSAHGDPRR